MKSYSDKLKSPQWQKKRLEILNRDNFTCCNCGESEKTLHVHHKMYQYGKDPWDYIDSTFVTLCIDCHETEEYYKQDFNGVIHDLLLMGYSYGALHTMILTALSKTSESPIFPPYIKAIQNG